MNFEILTLPNPILRQKARAVNPNDLDVQKLALAMKEFLAHGSKGKSLGVGLAAPQIGQSIRIIIIYSPASRRYLTMINPQIIWRSKRTRLGVSGRKNPFEGCLSVPGFWGKVRRHSVVKIHYYTSAGKPMVRKFRSFPSVVVQHELDHLDGILFIDRIKEQEETLYRTAKNKEGKEILVAVETQ